MAVGPAPSLAADSDDLPVELIERILQVRGKVDNGVLDISIAREDLHGVTGPLTPGSRERIPFGPGFELNGDFTFQSTGGGNVILNADFAFLAQELEPGIDAMLQHGLQMQAMHQHYPGLEPMVWFMHFRGQGPAEQIAQAAAAVVHATATPLPQQQAPQQTTLPKEQIGQIIGAKPEIADDGDLQ